MDLNAPSIRDLILRLKENEQDLLLGAVSSFTPSDVVSLAETLRESILIPRPGQVLCPGPEASFGILNTPESLRGWDRKPVWFCDVRLLGNESFPGFLQTHAIREILLPFSDCAIEGEYGYRRSYENLSSLRADGVRFHLTLFTDEAPDAEMLREKFGCEEVISFSPGEAVSLQTEKLADEAEQFSVLTSICEKYVWQRTAIFFTTRRQAERFAAGLRARFTPFSLVHGGLSGSQNMDALRRYDRGDTNVLLASKTLLCAAPFVRADKLLFCGLPYSESHAKRLCAIGNEAELICMYTDEDVALNRKLIDNTPAEMTYDHTGTILDRSAAFEHFLHTRCI